VIGGSKHGGVTLYRSPIWNTVSLNYYHRQRLAAPLAHLRQANQSQLVLGV
jgi:hypothetical protein